MVCPPSRRLVSELSPIVPTFVPVLDGVSALPRSCPPLSPFLSILVSGCLHVSLDMCACIGWCVRLLDVLSPRVSHCLPLSPQLSSSLVCPLSPINSPHWCLCWMVSPPWIISAFNGPCLRLSPIVSPHVCLCWMVCPPSQGFVSLVSQLVFLLVPQLGSQLVFLLVSLWGWWSDFAFFSNSEVYC